MVPGGPPPRARFWDYRPFEGSFFPQSLHDPFASAPSPVQVLLDLASGPSYFESGEPHLRGGCLWLVSTVLGSIGPRPAAPRPPHPRDPPPHGRCAGPRPRTPTAPPWGSPSGPIFSRSSPTTSRPMSNAASFYIRRSATRTPSSTSTRPCSWTPPSPRPPISAA